MNQPHLPKKGGLRSVAAIAGVGVLFVVLATGLALAQHSYAADGAAAGTSPNYLKWWFRILAGMTLLGACMTIVMRNPVVAALCLVGTLLCTGGIYLLLHATFLAAIQVLVYAGAIMVLFIFVVMSVGQTDQEEIVGRGSVVSKFAGALAVAGLIFVISPLFKSVSVPQPGPVPSTFGDVRMVGKLLFTDYLFPFEALSIPAAGGDGRRGDDHPPPLATAERRLGRFAGAGRRWRPFVNCGG